METVRMVKKRKVLRRIMFCAWTIYRNNNVSFGDALKSVWSAYRVRTVLVLFLTEKEPVYKNLKTSNYTLF